MQRGGLCRQAQAGCGEGCPGGAMRAGQGFGILTMLMDSTDTFTERRTQ
jgi:hypothetical protein